MESSPNYKDTLRLPSTTFPIKPNFAQNEQARYEKWKHVYENKRGWSVCEPFIMHDGPPYANGDIHVGHALNKILKDFVTKYHYFKQRDVEFVPGWDCHGLPIEQKAKGDLTDPVEIRRACRKYAAEQVEIQKAQFKSLGIVADWDNPYLTMSPEFELAIYDNLVELLNRGMLHTQKKPVFWSWAEKTALAEAEVVYKDRTDMSAYVLFDTSMTWKLAVWTTTPWTLPANEMIAGAKGYYVLAKSSKNELVVVSDECYSHLKELGYLKEIIRDLHWSSLEKITVNGLFGSKEKPLVFDNDFVDGTKGTGFVHVAPGHGPEDYQFANMKEFAMPVDESGRFTSEIQALTGLDLEGCHVLDANEAILSNVKLLGLEEITHSYPHCWRSGQPLIYRATDQWFLDLNLLRENVLKSLNNVEFESAAAKEKLVKMVEERPDWCISRQRDWGVPIAFLRKKSDGIIHLNCEKTREIFKNKGIDSWWTEPIKSFLELGENPDDYEKIFDVLDVWFDSGISWTTLPKKQASLYLEGQDQYRGWFQSSLWLSQALNGQSPYQALAAHGFVVDGNGRKMAKSEGNVISPLEVTSTLGAEILRYWVATVDCKKELRLDKSILNSAVDGYKKIRNTFRFLLANIDGTGRWAESYRHEDLWILDHTLNTVNEVDKLFGKQAFHLGMAKLLEFINSKLSNIYMNSIKDTLYCDRDYPGRYSIQRTLEVILFNLVSLLKPILTYTMEEVIENCSLYKNKSVFSTENYRANISTDFSSTMDENFWLKALKDFHEAFNKLKTEGLVKDVLEVGIGASLVSQYKSWPTRIDNWFVVSWAEPDAYIDVTKHKELCKFGEFNEFKIYLSGFAKCARCWKRAVITGDLCSRCQKAIDK